MISYSSIENTPSRAMSKLLRLVYGTKGSCSLINPVLMRKLSHYCLLLFRLSSISQSFRSLFRLASITVSLSRPGQQSQHLRGGSSHVDVFQI